MPEPCSLINDKHPLVSKNHDLSKKLLKGLFVPDIFDKETYWRGEVFKEGMVLSTPTEVTLDDLFYFINTITQKIHGRY